MAERNRLLLVSPDLQEEKAPRRTAYASVADGYALSLCALPGYYAAAIAGPASHVIDIVDSTTLVRVQTLPGHDIATTSLRTINALGGTSQKCLVSSGKDGSILAWDLRSTTPSIKITNPGKKQALMSFDVSPDGMTVAAGTDLNTKMEEASILYWDPRNPTTVLRSHDSTHSDDITTMSFAPSRDAETNSNVLLSGSSDGLLCTSNADEDDEDEAQLQVGNWGCSISQAGWCDNGSDPDKAAIWAGSDMETFSTWKTDLEQLSTIDLRTPVLHSGGREWVTDYFITAKSTSSPKLSVFAGSNQGDLALLSNTNFSARDAPWCLHKMWTHGHTGVVRDALWDEINQTLVTGGEDGKINVWPSFPITTDNGMDDSDEDVVMESPKSRKREPAADADRGGKRAKK